MNTSTLIYHPLLEEQSTKGWDKQTIEYILNNKTKIKGIIGSYAKSINKKLSSTDVEDCYSEVLLCFYEGSDYDIGIATERAQGKDGKWQKRAKQRREQRKQSGKSNKSIEEIDISTYIIPLEAYISKITKFVVMRFVNESFDIKNKERSIITYNKDGSEELDLLDTIPDPINIELNYEESQYKLAEICKQYESYRYKYIIDIFQLWFLKLVCIKHNKEVYFKEILETLGISKTDIRYMKKESKHSEVMIDMAKAISVAGVDEAIKVLRNFTYSAERLERLVEII